MAVINYDTPNGQILGQSNGSQAITFMTDALGSIIGTIQSGAVVNRYIYSPYGTLIAKQGMGADPRFLWNGQHGYSTTSRTYSEIYARYRHLNTIAARWTTTDPLWPNEEAYLYASSNPIVLVDPSGLISCKLRPNSEYKTMCPTQQIVRAYDWFVSDKEQNGWILQLVEFSQESTFTDCNKKDGQSLQTAQLEVWQVVAGVVYNGKKKDGAKTGGSDCLGGNCGTCNIISFFATLRVYWIPSKGESDDYIDGVFFAGPSVDHCPVPGPAMFNGNSPAVLEPAVSEILKASGGAKQFQKTMKYTGQCCKSCKKPEIVNTDSGPDFTVTGCSE